MKLRIFLTFFFCFQMAMSGLQAEEFYNGPGGTTEPLITKEAAPQPLKYLHDKLIDAIAEALLSAGGITSSVNENELRIKYHTRSYQVYSGSKTGEYGEELHTVTGPRSDGLIVIVDLRDIGLHPVAAFGDQLTREPYWFAENRTFTLQGNLVLYLYIQYGKRTNRAAINAVEETLQNTSMLKAAETKILDGLGKLSDKFPQLKKTNVGTIEEALAKYQREIGRIGFSIGHYSFDGRGGDNDPVDQKDSYRFGIDLHPGKREAAIKHAEGTLLGAYQEAKPNLFFDHLGLIGHTDVYAGDPKLEKALDSLLSDALSWLRASDHGASVVNPNPGGSPFSPGKEPFRTHKVEVFWSTLDEIETVIDVKADGSRPTQFSGRSSGGEPGGIISSISPKCNYHIRLTAKQEEKDATIVEGEGVINIEVFGFKLEDFNHPPMVTVKYLKNGEQVPGKGFHQYTYPKE